MDYTECAIARHENTLVLQYVDMGVTDPEEIANLSGMGQFKVRLIIRRLVRAHLLEYV